METAEITTSKLDMTLEEMVQIVRSWPRTQQVKFLRELREMVNAAEVDEEITLKTLQQVYGGQAHQALRLYTAEEVIGSVNFQGRVLSIEDEKNILTEALMEKYG